MTAELTTGQLTGYPVGVAYASTEEVARAVVVPRLIAAGTDLDRVIVPPMGSLGLPEELPRIAEYLRTEDVTWLFLDPVNAHFSRNLDPNRTKDVSHVLNELAHAAAEHHLTIVGNLHTNRGGGVSPRDRYAHQSEFRRQARSSWIIGRGPDDGEDERTIVHDKHSYTAAGPALSASVEVVDGVATLVLGEVVDVTAEELFLRDADKDALIRSVRGARTKVEECSEAITTAWEALGKPTSVPSSAFSQVAAVYGKMTVARARKRLAISVENDTDPSTNRVTAWTWVFT